jgi:hypothetical protein
MKSLKEINIQMKKFNQILISFSLVFVFSCDTEDLLIEEAVSNQTADSFFSTPAGFEDLSKSIYPLLRVIVEQRELVLNGTDLFASTSVWDETSNVLLNNRIDTYGSELTDGAGAITDLWTVLYKQINRSNILIDRAEAVKEGDATLVILENSNNFHKQFNKPAAFLDRDGVINYDHGYVHKMKNFDLRLNVIKGLKYLNRINYNIFIVTK